MSECSEEPTPVVSIGVYGHSNPGQHAVAYVARRGDRYFVKGRLLGSCTTPSAWEQGLAWAQQECRRRFPVLFRVRDKRLARSENVVWVPKALGDVDMQHAQDAARSMLEGKGGG